jgi:hypothetical protein
MAYTTNLGGRIIFASFLFLLLFFCALVPLGRLRKSGFFH